MPTISKKRDPSRGLTDLREAHGRAVARQVAGQLNENRSAVWCLTTDDFNAAKAESDGIVGQRGP